MTTREAGKAGPVATATLIEAVRVKYWYVRGPYSEELASNLHPIVKRADYDALRAATVAALDELLPHCGECWGTGVRRGDDPQDVNNPDPCPCCTSARALREKLR